MRPSRLAVLFLVLVLVGLALLAIRTRGAAPAPLPTKPAPAAAARSSTAELPGASHARQPLALRLLPATLAQEPQAARGAFEGRVVSAETGAGVEGAELTFASDTGASSVRSGKDGHFRYEPPAPGPYQLATVTAQGYVPFAPEWGQSPVRLTAVAGQRVDDIVLALTPQLSLLGRVLSPEGTPVAGAQVRLLTGRAGESVLHPVADRFVSDEKGEFRVLAPERATLEARHPGYAAGRAVIGPAVKLAHRVELRLGARRAGTDGGADAAERTLAGVVVDAQGQPVAGARVDAGSSAQRYPQRYGEELGYQAAADEQGRFVLEGLPGGYYDVAAQLPGLTPARLKDVAAGRTDLRLVLRPGATLSGRVQDAHSGAPLPSFTVVVSLQVGALQREPVAELTVLDPGGRYRVQGLPAGRHVVEVVAPGHAPGEAQVEVPAGEGRAVEADFQLQPGARVSGTVVSAGTGKPVYGARVSLETGRGEGALSVQLDAHTDAQGAFTLEGLAPGAATLMASADGHHTRLQSGVPVGGAAGPLRIELTPTKPGEEPSVELFGIGVVLAARGDMLVVGEVVPGGGGAEAGLTTGDGIFTIDGQRVVELGFTEAIQRIRGPEGSRVLLGLRRGAGLAAARGDAGPGAGGPLTQLWVPRRRIVR